MKNNNLINISYLNLAAQSPSLELNLSVSEEIYNKSKNSKHILYMCDSALDSCSVNLLKRKSICKVCTHKAKEGFKVFNERNPNSELRKITKSDFTNLKKPELSTELYDEILFGVHSTISTHLRLDNMDMLNKTWKRIKNKMISSSINLFHFFNQELTNYKVENFVIFNGRINCARPLSLVSKLNNVNYTLFDGNINGRIPVIAKNEMFHSINFQKTQSIKSYLKNFKESKKLAEEYMHRKINKIEVDDHAYIKDQITGHIDKEIIQYSKPIITIYVSSDDEYRFLGNDWNEYGIVDQIDCIKEINNSDISKKFALIVKMHPNQKNLHDSIKKRYVDLSKEVKVLFPDNKTDTYSLLMKSELIINFCSTVGIEANYLRKPVVQIGPSRFRELPGANYVSNSKEAISMILNKKYKLMPLRASIIYFTFYMKDVHNLKAYEYIEDGVYKYGGKSLSPDFLLRVSPVLDKIISHIITGNKSIFSNIFLHLNNLIFNTTKVK
jgi:hypothetical protein